MRLQVTYIGYAIGETDEQYRARVKSALMRGPVHHNTNLTGAQFRSGVCCEHDWACYDREVPTYWCPKCGATCTRDKDGKIDWYDAYGGPPDAELDSVY